MKLGIFCRPDHPSGFGHKIRDPELQATNQASNSFFGVNLPTESYGAHGYVTVIMVSHSADEFKLASDILTTNFKWKDRNDFWFSGRLDCVLVADIDVIYQATQAINQFRSIGDNRAVAYVTADEILYLNSI